MAEIEDWLKDPLRIIKGGSHKSRRLKSHKKNQNGQWQSFHFATRLKLDGADYFARQALGAASRPHDLGLPLLADRQLRWYLDAFFFELISAYDILLQELNIVYAYDLSLQPKEVRWNKKKKNEFMEKLPEEIFKYIKEERNKDWFKRVQWYRNMTTHQIYIPISSGTTWVGDILNYTQYNVRINCFDNAGNLIQGDIKKVCPEYLRNMVNYISSVWGKMTQEFE